MEGDLFSKPAEYTIDSCSLMDIFNDDSWASKKVNSGLWTKIAELIDQGVIISHAEVLLEIKKDGTKGEELFNWANANSPVFKDHAAEEGNIIRDMSKKYKVFVNNKVDNAHADPWLIAQAKHRNIKIITEETFSNSSKPLKQKIPNVCGDPLFNVKYLNLLGLCKERNWVFQ